MHRGGRRTASRPRRCEPGSKHADVRGQSRSRRHEDDVFVVGRIFESEHTGCFLSQRQSIPVGQGEQAGGQGA